MQSSSLQAARPAAPFSQARPSRSTRQQRGFQPVQATLAPPPPARDAAAVPNNKPEWAGEDKLSQIVNGLISNKVLFQGMKAAARFQIKSQAMKKGVNWDAKVKELEAAGVKDLFEEIEDKRVRYPDYYTQPFHGYQTGNLNWLCALEAEPATDVMALLPYKNEPGLNGAQAQARLRNAITTALRSFAGRHGLKEPRAILDVACSAGISSRWLATEYPEAQVTGIDLSPYMLSVAELRERQWEEAQKERRRARGKAAASSANTIPAALATDGALLDSSLKRKRIKYKHANIECTGFANGSFDTVAVQFLVHECPNDVIERVVSEGRRLLRDGGVLAIVDMNPSSNAAKRIPPALATVLKSTEPWTDDYFTFPLEQCLAKNGFREVECHELDPRHRIVLGHAPQKGAK